MFVFDEELGLLFRRAKAMGIDLEAMRSKGVLHIEQIDATELSPGEFAHRVRMSLSKDNTRTVIIDSLNGYQSAMPEEHSLILHMHELLQFLNRQGCATFLTVAWNSLATRAQRGACVSAGQCRGDREARPERDRVG